MVLFSFSGCVTPVKVIDKNSRSSILHGAKKVIVYSKSTADSLYHQVYNVLSDEGYTVLHSSYEMHQVSAKRSLNPHGTYVIVNILVDKDKQGSKAYMSGVWTDDFYKDETAEWSRSDIQLWKISFAYIVKIAQNLNGNIMYAR